MIDEETLLDRVLAAGGPSNRLEAERVIRATFAGIAEGLPRAARFALAAELPKEWRDVLLVHRQRRPVESHELYAIVRRRTNLGAGHAREGAQIVCQTLCDLMSDELRARVLDGVTPSVAELFRHREWGETPSHTTIESRHIAAGRPGSSHPLSESHPRSAQQDSVVTSENPHGDTKMSSARGTTQERENESIAAGHTDDRHTISRAS